MPIADILVERIAACGFELVGADDREAAITRATNRGIEFVGTHAEIESYLYGWMASREAMASEKLGADSVIQAAIVSLCADFPIQPSDPGSLRHGGMVLITNRPQVPFRGERVVIPDEIAPYFDVHDITVGNRSCMVHAARFPATAFAARIENLGALTAHAAREAQPFRLTIDERAVSQAGLRIAMPMTQVAQDITIAITNKTDEPHPFECYVIGQTVRFDSTRPSRHQPRTPTRMSAADVQALVNRWQEIVDQREPKLCERCEREREANPRGWSACSVCTPPVHDRPTL
jgi:hypothetical protein